MAEAVLSPRFLHSVRTPSSECRHPSIRKHQARKPEQREELGLIPDDAAIAHLVMPEEILDDTEGMLGTRWSRRAPGNGKVRSCFLYFEGSKPDCADQNHGSRLCIETSMCPSTAGPSVNHETRIAIIGAGFSGLGMAIRLKQAGIEDFLVLERAADIGGTWRDNSYPGCAVDVKSHLYSFSFAPNPEWTQTYPSQRELWDYIKRVCVEHRVLPHLRLGTHVASGIWDDVKQRWRLDTSNGAIEAQFLVSAMGPLSEPALPDIPGLESFEGRLFHSSRWDHDHDLSGKRVGVIGTGSSAAQFIPRIQPRVRRLTVFQRTPHWTFPRMNRRITKLERTLYRRFPALQQAVRARQYLYHEFLGFMLQHSRVLEASSRLRLRLQVRDRELRAKLTPDYRMGCKRVVVSDDFHPALTRPNVHVVTENIVEISPGGVLTADGAEHAMDTLILGTGFRPMPIADPLRGRDGDTLTERWKHGRFAYYGTTVSGFPNYFMLGGPNTVTGHTSVLLYAEAQTNYIVRALQYLSRHRKTSLEVRESVQRSFNFQLHRSLKRTVWLTGGCTSWYLNEPNGTSVLWPGYTWSFRKALRRFDAENYVLRGIKCSLQTNHAHSTHRPLASQSS